MYDQNNVFAKILRKEIPSKIIYEDKLLLFIYDAYPRSKIHILGLPKLEVLDFGDFILKADKEFVNHFFSKTYEVIESMGINKTGFKIIMNSGKDGGQEVPHFHIHILSGENLRIKKI